MIYGTRIDKYDLGEFGIVEYSQWLSPTFTDDWKPVWEFTEAHVKSLRQYIKPGDTVIDIGANVGYVMLPMLLAASPGGTVLAFEPCPPAFEVLQENARLNQHRCNIRVFNKAVTEATGPVPIHYSTTFHNGRILGNFASAAAPSTGEHLIEGDGIELHSFLEREGIKLERVSFIKIDTEGYDRKILRSISWLIDKFQPVMRVEYLSVMGIQERTELYEVLRSLKYDLFWDHKSNGRYTPDGHIEGLEDFLARTYICDMLCFPERR